MDQDRVDLSPYIEKSNFTELRECVNEDLLYFLEILWAVISIPFILILYVLLWLAGEI